MFLGIPYSVYYIRSRFGFLRATRNVEAKKNECQTANIHVHVLTVSLLGTKYKVGNFSPVRSTAFPRRQFQHSRLTRPTELG